MSAAAGHSGLSVERWRAFAFPQQILMIANELHRAAKLTAPDDAARRAAAFERVLSLVDLTVTVLAAADRLSRLRELLRWRDLAAETYALASAEPDRNLMRALLRFTPESARQIPEVLGEVGG